jgi:hypothetical protein
LAWVWCEWMRMGTNKKNLSNAMEKVHKFHQWYSNKPKSIPHGTR